VVGAGRIRLGNSRHSAVENVSKRQKNAKKNGQVFLLFFFEETWENGAKTEHTGTLSVMMMMNYSCEPPPC